jgi:protocatechuate 3,4-dioxygenase beta subunit
VRLRRVLDQNRAEILPHSAITDESGRYTIGKVPPGDYLVESLRPDTRGTSVYYPSALPYNPGGFWPRGASRIRVDAGRPVSGVDMLFTRRRITGRVVDSTGQSMPSTGNDASGRFEGLVILDRVGVYQSPSEIPPDANGRFQFDDLEPGEYLLRAVVFGVRPCAHCISNVAREFAARTITVSGSDVDAVEMQLQRATTLRGRLALESGEPIDAPGLRLMATQQGLWPEIRGNQDTMLERVLNRDGTFTINGVVAGVVVDIVNAPTGWFVKSITAGTPRRPTEPIAPGTLEEVVVLLSTGGARLTGRVVGSPSAAGARDLSVYVFPIDEQLWSGAPLPGAVKSTTVTETLEYAVSSIAPGDYYVVAVTATTLKALADRARSAARLPEDHLKEILRPLVARARRITLVERQSQRIDVPIAPLPQ